jgi:hypothetical protein
VGTTEVVEGEDKLSVVTHLRGSTMANPPLPPSRTYSTPVPQLRKMASIDAQMRLLVPRKVSEDDKLIEYDALLLDRFLDILQELHGEEIKETVSIFSAFFDEPTQVSESDGICLVSVSGGILVHTASRRNCTLYLPCATPYHPSFWVRRRLKPLKTNSTPNAPESEMSRNVMAEFYNISCIQPQTSTQFDKF